MFNEGAIHGSLPGLAIAVQCVSSAVNYVACNLGKSSSPHSYEAEIIAEAERLETAAKTLRASVAKPALRKVAA